MAQAFARLGSPVQLIQRGDRILPLEDPDLADVVAAQLRRDGVDLLTDHQPLRLAGGPGDIRIIVKDAAGKEKQLSASHLLIAAGRRPNIEGLGLEAAGIRTNQDGIITDERLRTSQKHIFAAGDVTGGPQFTHMAEHHAGVVLRNAIFHLPARVERKVIPRATFSDPELARVGLSETEAKQQGIRHQVFSFPFQELDRARTDATTEGLAKIITSPRGKLLGAAIVGPHAGELIHEYVLAIANGMSAADLSRVIHIYPTLAQINRRVADARMKQGLTPRAKRWIKRIFNLRGG
jgi:pyruvate/2-oxoglutarate dehydrogenase complex dihydrolipoamide dehydrogenase (E3) component